MQCQHTQDSRRSQCCCCYDVWMAADAACTCAAVNEHTIIMHAFYVNTQYTYYVTIKSTNQQTKLLTHSRLCVLLSTGCCSLFLPIFVVQWAYVRAIAVTADQATLLISIQRTLVTFSHKCILWCHCKVTGWAAAHTCCCCCTTTTSTSTLFTQTEINKINELFSTPFTITTVCCSYSPPWAINRRLASSMQKQAHTRR